MSLRFVIVHFLPGNGDHFGNLKQYQFGPKNLINRLPFDVTPHNIYITIHLPLV